MPATPLPVPLGGMATLREWLANPDGLAALRELVTRRIGSAEVLDDERIRYGLGAFPVAALAAFLGMGIPAVEFDEVAAARGLDSA